MSLTIGSLCTGSGALDLAAQRLLDARTVWHSETDRAANTLLEERWPGVPNHGDIAAIAWDRVEPVDVLTMGFPCQDVSSAGLRAGLKPGTRSGLWTECARAINALRPQIVIIENVRGLLNARADSDMGTGPDAVGDTGPRPILRAAGAVLGGLCSLRYDAQWVTIPASLVGAPHRRERVFILATTAHARHDRLSELREAHNVDRRSPRGHVAHGCPAGPDLTLLPTPTRSDCFGVGEHGDGAADLRTTLVQRLPGAALDLEEFTPACRRWRAVIGRDWPVPLIDSPRSSSLRINPAFSEWMMGWPDGWVTDLDAISHQASLRIIGNGVVPQQAHAALSALLTVAGEEQG